MNPDDISRRIARTFLGGAARPRRPRSRPNRCQGCGKVTRHVFCPATRDQCRALYHARQKEN